MNVTHQITVNAPTSELWQILAVEYDQISQWATAVLESGPNPAVSKGEGRVCLTTFGRNVETIKYMDEQAGTFTYQVILEKSPFFLRNLENTFTIQPVSENQSLVKMNANVSLLPVFSLMMGPIMKKRMLTGFGKILEEVKHYAEKGEVHPRKQMQVNAVQA